MHLAETTDQLAIDMTLADPQPLISLVIPVRNAPHDLWQCLSRVSESTFADYEIVVVDDASTDHTRDIARGFPLRLIELPKCLGPAGARNAGAEAARGRVLFFIDADVCVYPHTLGQVADLFAADAELAAVFGSYDDVPHAPHFLSQYRNLLHHFTHQQASRQAATFWSGCGAIRRDDFFAMGGFDSNYGRPSIEDIELGVRLFKSGRRIILARELQVTHLKRWTLWNILRTDVRDRALPWTRLILRERSLPNDLNLKSTQRTSALFSGLLVAVWLSGVWFFPLVAFLPALCFALIVLVDRYGAGRRWMAPAAFLVILAATALAGRATPGYGLWAAACSAILGSIVVLNRHFYAFLARVRDFWFAALVVPMHVLYYLYSAAAFAWALVTHRLAPLPNDATTGAASPSAVKNG